MVKTGKITRQILILVIVIAATIACKSEKQNDVISPINLKGILKVSADGVFMRDGKAYHGIGINYFNNLKKCINQRF